MFTQIAKWWQATRDADERKMLAWDNEDAQLQCDHKVILWHTPLRAGNGPGEARVAESPSRRVAHFSLVAESRVAARSPSGIYYRKY